MKFRLMLGTLAALLLTAGMAGAAVESGAEFLDIVQQRVDSGEITADDSMAFASNYSDEDRRHAMVNLLKAHAGEASMMARCTGKTNVHNLEPEDLRAITLAVARASGVPMSGSLNSLSAMSLATS